MTNSRGTGNGKLKNVGRRTLRIGMDRIMFEG